MAENNNPSYPIDAMNHYVMNRVMRHRLRNLCAGVKMTAERIATMTASTNPQIGSRCDIVIAEVDNLRDFTDRMDLLFDALPMFEAKSLFDLVIDARTFFAPKFPFGKLNFSGPEAMVNFAHGSWLMVALHELLINAGEAAGEGGEVLLAWTEEAAGWAWAVSNSGEQIAAEIPLSPPTPFMTTRSRHDGLGLAIVWRICVALGATLEITTALEGLGTRVMIKLPRSENNNE